MASARARRTGPSHGRKPAPYRFSRDRQKRVLLRTGRNRAVALASCRAGSPNPAANRASSGWRGSETPPYTRLHRCAQGVRLPEMYCRSDSASARCRLATQRENVANGNQPQHFAVLHYRQMAAALLGKDVERLLHRQGRVDRQHGGCHHSGNRSRRRVQLASHHAAQHIALGEDSGDLGAVPSPAPSPPCSGSWRRRLQPPSPWKETLERLRPSAPVMSRSWYS